MRIETNNSTWPPPKALRGFCSAALPVTGITGAHNGQIVQDSSSGHARRTCLKPELSSSEMVSLLRGITDHLTTWNQAVPPWGKSSYCSLDVGHHSLQKRASTATFLISANHHQGSAGGEGSPYLDPARSPLTRRAAAPSKLQLATASPEPGRTVTLVTD